jgi:hypothetical protein
VEIEAASEDSESAEDDLFRRGKEIMAPLDGRL